MKRLRIRVSGDVQGVFYRHFASDEAKKLGVTGWIRNDPDGTVFMVVEGESAVIDKFLAWSKEGSPMANVEDIDVVEEEYIGESEGFEIR